MSGNDDAITGATRVCFFAQYHQLGLAADHTLYYLDALRAAGFKVVVASTSAMTPDESTRLREHCDVLFFRENVGLDFGGWAECFRRYQALSCELLLLANDSVYGPVTDLSAFIDNLVVRPADFYGAVASTDTVPHLQSWFVLLRPSAYQSAAFRNLLLQVTEPTMSKRQIIERFEMGLTVRLQEAGLRWVAAFDRQSRLATRYGYNPAHLLWKQLVEDYQVPFVKVELVRLNPLAIQSASRVISVVAQHNPTLAGLIEKDLRHRPASAAPTGVKAWAKCFSTTTRPEHWVEAHSFIVRDYSGLSGVRDTVNRAGLKAAVTLGKAARLPAKLLSAAKARLL